MNAALETNKSETEMHKEGPIAKAIEKQTAKVPSDAFLWLALGSIGASLAFQLKGQKETSTFIGQWAPTLLILGLYNKLVKVAGSDQASQSRELNPASEKGMRSPSLASTGI